MNGLKELKVEMDHNAYSMREKPSPYFDQMDFEKFINEVLVMVLHNNQFYRPQEGKRFAEDFNRKILELFELSFF